MPAEQTATMIAWPKDCGHGWMMPELVEHFRPYSLRRRMGCRDSAVVAAPRCVLTDAEIEHARAARVSVEVVDIAVGATWNRSDR